MTPPTFEYCHYNYDTNAESEEQYTGGNDICGDGTVEGNCVIGERATIDGRPWLPRFVFATTYCYFFTHIRVWNLRSPVRGHR